MYTVAEFAYRSSSKIDGSYYVLPMLKSQYIMSDLTLACLR